MLVQPIDGNFGLGPASGPSKPLTHTSTTALRQRRPFPPPGINPTVLVAFSKPSLKVSSRAHLGSFQPDGTTPRPHKRVAMRGQTATMRPEKIPERWNAAWDRSGAHNCK
jgi:hypothetical protein